MQLKAGMKVVRQSDKVNGSWYTACTRKGLDPYGVFTISYMSYGPVFTEINYGYWEASYFSSAIPSTDLEDWL